MSTLHADSRLTPTRRVSTDTPSAYGAGALLPRAVVAIAALIAGGDR